MRIRRLAAKFKPVLFLKCLKWDMYVVLYVQFIEKKEIAVVFTKCHNSTFSVNPLRKNCKPAYLHMTEDIDWVPTKNLKTEQENVSSSLHSSNSI